MPGAFGKALARLQKMPNQEPAATWILNRPGLEAAYCEITMEEVLLIDIVSNFQSGISSGKA